MSAKDTHDLLLVKRLKIDLNRTSNKNPLEELVKPMQEFAKLVIKTNSKIHKPKTNNKAINNTIYRNKLQKAIDKKLWNLYSHQT